MLRIPQSIRSVSYTHLDVYKRQATNFISEHKMGLKDEGLGRIARYAIGYTGCVEIDGGYHDALLVSFFETTLESGFSAYVLYEGMGAGDGFMWSDPEPAGEETPLI